ncbi:hypothetical protein FHR81_003363 [Actinoalloteichus hoggarensis]|uniref:hypothetical protein n=1 Tax=Actinoalloteichus hoggarensis TaxID=1470176 RepID=UPI000B8B4A56|nr:hypothetical protein [Actinoalloteichus hoggarensis]MBB5922311.1 hypothetical protein [Actinoalloteichus hoggarensis]
MQQCLSPEGRDLRRGPALTLPGLPDRGDPPALPEPEDTPVPRPGSAAVRRARLPVAARLPH